MFLNWLRDKIKAWIFEDTSVSLEVLVDGKIETVVARGAVGLRLVCALPGPVQGERLISSGQAVDPQRFARIWRQLSGGFRGATWEDGDPYSPE